MSRRRTAERKSSRTTAAAGPLPKGVGGRPGRGPWRADLTAAALVALVVVAVFGQTVGFDFVLYDDNVHIYENARLWPATWHSLAEFWRRPFFGEYVPLAYTAFAAQAWLSRQLAASPLPAVFHAGSVLMHVGCCWAAYALLRQLKFATRPAAAATLMFGLHPLAVESVSWVSEQRGLLAGLFGLSALATYLSAVDATNSAAGQRHLVRYLWATLLYALALASKPSAVAIPLMAAVLDVGSLKRRVRDAALWLAPWGALAAALIAVTKLQQPDAQIHGLTAAWTRPLVALDALAFYLLKTVWPWPLGPDYGRTPVSAMASGSLWWTWLAPTSVGACVAWRGGPAFRVAGALLVAALAAVLGLLPFAFQETSTTADRYAYLALFGLAWAVAATWEMLTERLGRRTVAAICVAVLTIFAGLSCRQSAIWRDSESLFQAMLRQNPKSFAAHNNLSVLRRNAGKSTLDEAVALARRAISLRPHNADAYTNLGAALLDQGQAAEAATAFALAVERAPGALTNRRNLALALTRAGDVAAAAKEYRGILQAAPGDVGALIGLARVSAVQGRLEEAAERFEQVLQTAPQSTEALCGLAAVRQTQGDAAAALQLFRQAQAVPHPPVQAYFEAAEILTAQGSFAEAAANYERALKLSPQHLSATNNLAWLLATCPQPDVRNGLRAVELAELVARASDAPEAFDTLAAALAAAGRFDEAVSAASEAVAAARRAGQGATADDIQTRLDLYVQGQAYVQPTPTRNRDR